MSDTAPGAAAMADRNLPVITHVMYGLHTLSFFSAGIFSVVALLINLIKRDDLPNELYRSHFRWQSRSFWFTVLWLLLTAPLWLLAIPGWVAWSVIGLWYLYRFIRGWLCFFEKRPMPMT